jgi:hypothetical protein
MHCVLNFINAFVHASRLIYIHKDAQMHARQAQLGATF